MEGMERKRTHRSERDRNGMSDVVKEDCDVYNISESINKFP